MAIKPIIKWSYGRDPNPKTWHETVDALNSLHATHAHEKLPGITSRLDTLEKRFKSFRGNMKKGG